MKRKHVTMVRQGDVLIERVAADSRPQRSRPQKGRPVLAHGEATGHAHEIEEAKAATIADVEGDWGTDGDLRDSAPMTLKMLELTKESAVVHQEHARIPLEKGTYRVTRQREYSPEAIRNVQD